MIHETLIDFWYNSILNRRIAEHTKYSNIIYTYIIFQIRHMQIYKYIIQININKIINHNRHRDNNPTYWNRTPKLIDGINQIVGSPLKA